MRNLFLVLALFLSIPVYAVAVTRYEVSGGNGIWGSTTNWSTSSGGASGSSAPVAGDTAYFDGNSGNISLGADANCAVIGCTTAVTGSVANYNGTIDLSTHKLTVTGNVTLSSTTASTGTGALTITGSQTLTANGATWTPPLTFATGVGTVVVSGNWINTGLVTVGASTALNLSAAETFRCNGGISNLTVSILSGNINLVIAGGNWSCGNQTSDIAVSNVFIDGNVTLTSSVGTTSNITYTSGSVTGASYFWTIYGSCTINSVNGGNSLTFPNMDFVNGPTVTLASDLAITNHLRVYSVTTTLSGAHNISCGTLSCQFVGTAAGPTLVIPVGQTLTIANGIKIGGTNPPSGAKYTATILIKSSSASSAATIAYNGGIANCLCFECYFTYINATPNNIANIGGTSGMLSNCTGIINTVPFLNVMGGGQ